MTVAPTRLEPLAGDQPDSTSGGVEQDRLARLDRVGPADQVLGGHPLEHGGGRRPVRHAVRDRDQDAGRQQPRLGVRPGRAAGVGDPVARTDDGHARADRLDDPGRFAPQPARQRDRVQPGPVVGVDEVDPDGGVPDPGLSLAGLADLDVLPAHDFGPAGLGDANGFRHGRVLISIDRSPVSRRCPPARNRISGGADRFNRGETLRTARARCGRISRILRRNDESRRDPCFLCVLWGSVVKNPGRQERWIAEGSSSLPSGCWRPL